MTIDTLEPDPSEVSAEMMQAKKQITPRELREAFPVSAETLAHIESSRRTVRDILEGRDDRLLVISGPCSLDDAELENGRSAAVEHAYQQTRISSDPLVRRNLFIVERVPPGKPRSHLGQRGLEQTDPAKARHLLHDISELGMPIAIEIFDREQLAFYEDILSLGWVGARDVTSTKLRHTLSAYPEVPILFKNSVSGDMTAALHARDTVAASHANAPVLLEDGFAGYVERSPGNPHTGVIYRGGADDTSPKDFEDHLLQLASQLVETVPLLVDCSHANAAAHVGGRREMNAEGQKRCLDHLMSLMATHDLPISGIMIESYLLEGVSSQTPGMSRTDPCISLETTAEVLLSLAQQHGK